MSKITNPDTTVEALKGRLLEIAHTVADAVANIEVQVKDNSFETASNEFGLSHGASKLLEDVKEIVAIVRDNKAQTSADELTGLIHDIIGVSLLFKDFIDRNPALVGKVEEINHVIDEVTSVATGAVHGVEGAINHVETGIRDIINEAKQVGEHVAEAITKPDPQVEQTPVTQPDPVPVAQPEQQPEQSAPVEQPVPVPTPEQPQVEG